MCIHFWGDTVFCNSGLVLSEKGNMVHKMNIMLGQSSYTYKYLCNKMFMLGQSLIHINIYVAKCIIFKYHRSVFLYNIMLWSLLISSKYICYITKQVSWNRCQLTAPTVGSWTRIQSPESIYRNLMFVKGDISNSIENECFD